MTMAEEKKKNLTKCEDVKVTVKERRERERQERIKIKMKAAASYAVGPTFQQPGRSFHMPVAGV